MARLMVRRPPYHDTSHRTHCYPDMAMSVVRLTAHAKAAG